MYLLTSTVEARHHHSTDLTNTDRQAGRQAGRQTGSQSYGATLLAEGTGGEHVLWT